MNKFYRVQNKHSFDQLVNIVIAGTAKEAKRIGAFVEATESAPSLKDIEVHAIRPGMTFFWETDDIEYFAVAGKGFLYTDLPSQLDCFWDNFFKELEKQDRIKWEDEW